MAKHGRPRRVAPAPGSVSGKTTGGGLGDVPVKKVQGSSGVGESLTMKDAIEVCGVPEEDEANAELPGDLVDVVVQDLAQDLAQELAVGCRAEKPAVLKQSRVWARKPLEGRQGASLAKLPVVSGNDSVKGWGLDGDVGLDPGRTGEGSSADSWQATGGRHCTRPPASGVVGGQQGLVTRPNRFGSLQGQDNLVEQVEIQSGGTEASSSNVHRSMEREGPE
ncbi:hypothetical protein Dimus_004925 [Dionaea muscipula]